MIFYDQVRKDESKNTILAGPLLWIPRHFICTSSIPILCVLDFSFATKNNPVYRERCGTQSMLAPEQCSGKPYDPFASDIWQLGVTFFMILFNDMPYKKQRRKHIVKEIKGFTCHHKGVPLPYDVTLECKDLLAVMLSLEPKSRNVAQKVNESHWFKSIKWGL